MDDNRYKEKFHEAFHKASEKRIVRNGTELGSTYTIAMLRALKDMADNGVYPDWRFGDDDCNVWSMFSGYKAKDIEGLKGEIVRLNHNLSILSDAIYPLLKVIHLNGIEISGEDIIDSETGEVLSC